MQLPVQSQSTFYAEPWETTAGRDELAEIAVACDAAGFDYIAVCDHVAIPADKAEAMGTAWYDTVATLGWLAGITERVRLLSHVFVPAYRHPLATAKAFATLDELSAGRVILGIGAGHVEAEFDLLGIPFAERGKLTDAALDGIRQAWSGEFGWHGFGQRPRPVQPGGPPIWVGGSSPAAIRRAAERGDGWLPQGTLKKDMPAAIARIAELRPPNAAPCTIGAIAPRMYVGEPGWDVGSHTLTGDAGRIAAYLADYAAMGVAQVQVRFRSRTVEEYLDQIEVFSQDVA